MEIIGVHAKFMWLSQKLRGHRYHRSNQKNIQQRGFALKDSIYAGNPGEVAGKWN